MCKIKEPQSTRNHSIISFAFDVPNLHIHSFLTNLALILRKIFSQCVLLHFDCDSLALRWYFRAQLHQYPNWQRGEVAALITSHIAPSTHTMLPHNTYFLLFYFFFCAYAIADSRQYHRPPTSLRAAATYEYPNWQQGCTHCYAVSCARYMHVFM